MDEELKFRTPFLTDKSIDKAKVKSLGEDYKWKIIIIIPQMIKLSC